MQGEPEDFGNNSTIVRSGHTPSSDEPGRIGWEIFRIFNLFLDLGNSKIAFCDSLSRLGKQGYSVEKFVQTPLILERGLVEFQAQTPDGPLRCMLDTGATWNILNIDIEEGRAIEEVVCDPKNISEIHEFRIGERDFGAIQFQSLPIDLPIRIDAILGMDFLQNHAVFIDFANGQIYFSQKM